VEVSANGSRRVVQATGDVALTRQDDQVVTGASVDVLDHLPDERGGPTGVGVLDDEERL
jgi:hypothetical protein